MTYLVVCEGPSERAYLQRLASLLEKSLPPQDDGYSPRLKLIPKITNEPTGGGDFKLVRNRYNQLCKESPRLNKIVWVDCDIYIRNGTEKERQNAKSYFENRGRLPEFHFSVMNYEDFLAMHFEDDLFIAWKGIMGNAQHFKKPLHSKEYEKLFNPIWQRHLTSLGCSPCDYMKGDLPVDFITVASLNRMIRRCQDQELCQLFTRHSPAKSFPELLSTLLREHYSEEFI
jgi:hypothetical protein